MSIAMLLQRIDEVEHNLETCPTEHRKVLYEMLDKLVLEYLEFKRN